MKIELNLTAKIVVTATAAVSMLIVSGGLLAAFADGLPKRPVPFAEPAPVKPKSTFTGCYAGAFGGWSITTIEAGVGPVVLDSLSGDGITGGVRAGCDWQLGPFLLGAFGEYSPWRDADFRLAVPGATFTAGLGDEWAVGLRAGTVIGGDTLLFVKGGYTESESHIKVTPAILALPAMPTFHGYFVGAGVEAMVARGAWWSLSVTGDYTASFYEAETIAGVSVDPTDHRVRFGLNVRFGVPQLVN